MRRLLLPLLPLLLVACGHHEPEHQVAPAKPQADAPADPQADQGRAETQGIRNTAKIGYAGDAVADKVDAALDANDERKKKMDAAIDGDSQ